MKNFSILRAVMVFLLTIIVDIFWGFYIRRTGQGKAIQAAIFGSAITFFGAFIVINYVKNMLYLIAAVLGSFVGTWLTVRYDAKNKQGPASK